MKKSAFIGIVIAGLLFGSSCIFVNFLSAYNFTLAQMIAMRASVAAVSTALVVFIYDHSLFKIDFKGLSFSVICGVAIYFTAVLYYVAMQETSVSTAVVLMYTAPIFVMIYSVIFFKEKFTKLKAVAVICIIIGCLLVSGVIGGFKFNFLGITYGLLSGVLYGFYNIVTKIAMRKKYRPFSIIVYGFITMGVLSVIFGDVGVIVETTVQAPLKIIPLIIGIGLFTCTIPYSLQTFCLKELPAGVVTSLGIIEPLSATIYSIVLLDDNLSVQSAFGVIMIVISIFLFSKTSENEE